MNDRIDTAAAAARLGVSRRAVVALIGRGKLPAVRAGRTWMIEPDALARIEHGHGGRPRRVTPEQWSAIDWALCQEGVSVRGLADIYGVHESTLYRRRTALRRAHPNAVPV